MKKLRYFLLLVSMLVFAVVASLTSTSISPSPAPKAETSKQAPEKQSVEITPTLYPAADCESKKEGDADCNNMIDYADFELLRKEFDKKGQSSSVDFDKDGQISIMDFEIWRRHVVTPTPTQIVSRPTATASPTILAQATRPSAKGYRVEGNRIIDSAGNTHLFRGINRPSLEWSATGENLSVDDFRRMRDWNANVVRLPMNQKYWRDDTSGYRQRISQTISTIESLGMDVILDLHWSDKGDSAANPAQQRMADANSIEFWKQVAAAYKEDGRVLFELYNEPHDVSWDVWLNGGDSGDGFASVGMQQMYDAVRSTGANNIVIIGGLNWAFDLSGVASHRVKGSNIMYATHPYNFPGKNNSGDWDRGFGYLLATDPVIMTEFGDTTAAATGDKDCDATFVNNLLSYTKDKSVSWTGWAWYPGGCGFPPIIKDWAGTPNSAGEAIKQALR